MPYAIIIIHETNMYEHIHLYMYMYLLKQIFQVILFIYVSSNFLAGKKHICIPIRPLSRVECSRTPPPNPRESGEEEEEEGEVGTRLSTLPDETARRMCMRVHAALSPACAVWYPTIS